MTTTYLTANQLNQQDTSPAVVTGSLTVVASDNKQLAEDVVG